MGTTTTTFALNKPTVGGDDNAWGTDLNANADKLDDLLDGTTAIKPNLSEGLWKVGGVAVTATAAELNILDGVTASTAEINVLDGVTASTAELNFVDGVTSAIQTQIDAKAPIASPTLTGTPAAPTAAVGTDTTQIATTAFVGAEIAADVGVANAALVKTALNASGSAPIYACRAWVNFNGTGTVAIRASGNVSSITDNGTGNYTVNFTTAMPDANYATNATSSTNQIAQQTLSSSAVQIFTQNSSGVAVDPVEVSITIFR